MLNNKIRPQANEITGKIGKKIPLNPNIVTLIGLFISFFAGGLFPQAETPGPIGPGVCVQILDPEQCLGN